MRPPTVTQGCKELTKQTPRQSEQADNVTPISATIVHSGPTHISGNARVVQGAINYNQNHIYPAGRSRLIDIDTGGATQLLATILNAVDRYRREENGQGRATPTPEEVTEIVTDCLTPLVPRKSRSPAQSTCTSRSINTTATLNRNSHHETDPKLKVMSQRSIDTHDPEDLSRSGPETLALEPFWFFRPRDFFQPGRVLALYWSEHKDSFARMNGRLENAVSGRSFKSAIGSHGNGIVSRFRHMIVVISRAEYAWCVGIDSYGGQGLAGRDLSQADIDAHTIVYDASRRPHKLEGEEWSFCHPIAVNMAKRQTLPPASRIFFAAPYHVGYGQMVKEVGQVHPLDLASFKKYAAQERLIPGDYDTRATRAMCHTDEGLSVDSTVQRTPAVDSRKEIVNCTKLPNAPFVSSSLRWETFTSSSDA